MVFGATTKSLLLSRPSTTPASPSSKKKGVCKKVPVPWLVQGQLPTNPLVVKCPGNNWLQKLLTRACYLLEG